MLYIIHIYYTNNKKGIKMKEKHIFECLSYFVSTAF